MKIVMYLQIFNICIHNHYGWSHFYIRFSDFLRVKCQKTSWEEKMAKKKEQQAIKDLEKKLKEQKIEKIQVCNYNRTTEKLQISFYRLF